MADEASTSEIPRWRISKACEECRRRKIRCDGGEPCQHCKLRNSECEYRGFVRHRKRKHEVVSKDGAEDNEDDGRSVKVGNSFNTNNINNSAGTLSSDAAPASSHLPTRSASGGAAAENSRDNVINYSVAATHVASPSCVIQLYYGPSSNFSLMQLMYRQLVEGYGEASSRGDEVEEAGPGLDLFSHRRLFFGDLAGSQDMSISDRGDLSSSIFFVHPSTATKYLDRYLSTIYHLMPWQPKDEYRRKLEQLYDRQNFMSLESPEATIMLLILAMGAAMTEEIDQGNFIFQRAKANAAKFDDLVNLQAIQIPLMMISLPHAYYFLACKLTSDYAHYQSERARPNSAYLYLGTAVRKAIAAGLHKNTLLQAERTTGDINEKRSTFWSLYFYETWMCFGLGRPMSIPAHEIAIPDPKEQPMLLALVELSRIMTKSARSIYGQRYESLLPLWKSAKDVRKDLHSFARRVHGVLNFGLEASPRPGEVGVCQTVLMLLYHTVTLLTFRPFLIFRARWRRDGPAKSSETQTTPSWLDDACESCLEAARCLIRYLSDCYQVNILVRNMKYHGFFLESACFTLAFDMMHMTPQMAEKHLPWVRLGYRCLASMLPKNQFHEQTSVTMNAIQQMLMAVFPNAAVAGGADFMSTGQTGTPAGAAGPASDEYHSTSSRSHDFPGTTSSSPHQPQHQQPVKSRQHQQQQQQQQFNNYSPTTDLANPSTFFNFLGQNLMTPLPVGGGGDGSTESNNQDDQLTDFPPLDMNWGDIDFSSMDLDAFLSIDPSATTASGMNSTAVPWGGNGNGNVNSTDLGLGLGPEFGGLR